MINELDLDEVIELFEKLAKEKIKSLPSILDSENLTSSRSLLEETLSEYRLHEIMKSKEVFTANDIPNNSNRIKFRPILGSKQKIKNVKKTGFFAYPPNGFYGWHTNNNNPGERLYIVYADEDKKSFFRFYDSDQNKIVTQWDQKGINIKRFNISIEKPFWHCVGSYCNRISAGFKL